MKIIIFPLLLFLCLEYSNGARLLAVFPFPGRSHYILSDKLLKGLAEAGHHVTMIVPYPTKGIPKNTSWEDIIVEGIADRYKEDFKNINMFEDSSRSDSEKMISYQNLMLPWVNATLFHPKVRALMTPATKFDAVILEPFFNDAHKYYAHYFQCPLILLSSIGAAPWVNNIVANPSPPAYIAYFFGSISDFSHENFWHRAINLKNYIGDYIVQYFHLDPLQNRILQHAHPGAPTIDELNKRVSLILLNGHESLSEAVPLVPSMIQIGGFHVDVPKQLPEDLHKFLDSAEEGVVYFSMGSNIKAKEMDSAKKQMLFNVLKKLKQKVLWKFEDENVPNIPKNVLIKSWMPQNEILAHPNVKLFITHGGLLSTTETIYHGVPVLAIPVFADQFINAQNAEKYGYGLKLPYNDKNFNEDTLNSLLRELLTNPKYKDNVKRRSAVFHDRPMKPMDTVIYWVNYVVRHNGAEHLKVAGATLPIYKYLMLDVFASIFAVIISILFIAKTIFKIVVSKIKPTKKQKLN